MITDTRNFPPISVTLQDYDRLIAVAETATREERDAANFLLGELRRASIIHSSTQRVVTMGSYVTFRDDSTGSNRAVQLVYAQDANAAAQRISVMTPVGAALLGLSEGQTMSWRTRDGREKSLTVLKIP
jgi:regulator of nucleoside diphosphate kinase